MYSFYLYSNEKIEFIINKLDCSLLPRNEEGICIYDGNLWCDNNQLTELPDNLIVNGDLDCSNNKLTELPYRLVVKDNLYCSGNKITKLPYSLIVKCEIYLTELLDTY